MRSQNDFIEVIASDTVHRKALSIVYAMTVVDYGGWPDGMNSDNNESQKNKISDLKSLKTEMDRAGIKYEPFVEEEKYTLPKEKKRKSVKLMFKDEKELDNMLYKMANFSGITGMISKVIYEPQSPGSFEKLYAKVYEMALEKATIMAKASNRKLGKLISVVPSNDFASESEMAQNPFASIFGGESEMAQNPFASIFSALGGKDGTEGQLLGVNSIVCRFRFQLLD